MKKISIIIPVYNMAHYIEQCLDSVVNQTLLDIEIVCIDDCSTDNSLEILEKYAAKDNRLRILKQDSNQGQGIARNLAINVAQGEYIMFVDPDDWLALDACEKAYNQIKKNDNDIVFFNFYKFDDKNKTAKVNETTREKLHSYSQLGNMNVIDNDIMYQDYSWTKIYKKEFLISNGCVFGPGRAAEDCPFAAITTIKAKSVSVLNLPLYYYRVNIKNSNRGKTIQRRVSNYNDVFDNRKLAFEIVNNDPQAGRFRNIFNAYYVNAIINSYKFYSSQDKSIRPALYKKIRKHFLDFVNENDINEIKDSINYFEFKKILRYKYSWMYKAFSIFDFSITHKKSTKGARTIITAFGIKMKFLDKQKTAQVK